MNSTFSEKDFYCVYNDFDISSRTKELNLLYLPLIGNDAISLYAFLGSKILSDKNLSKNYLHYDILETDRIKVKLSEKGIDLICVDDSNYFETLKKKLHWS